MCDAAYVLLLAEVDQTAVADRTAYASAYLQSGSKEPPTGMPSISERRAEFDAALQAPPVAMPDNLRRLRDLGVA